MKNRFLLACLATLGLSLSAAAEDGYDLWLRYPRVDSATYGELETHGRELVAPGTSATLEVARDELMRGLAGLAGKPVALVAEASGADALYIGTPRNSPAIASLGLSLRRAGEEGYLIRAARIGGRPATVIAANTDM